MEKNQFEGLDEVETNDKPEKEVKELKEYEKLLKVEENRKYIEKANTLIEFGCFEQREVTEFPFNEYDFVDGKKYKGKYNLYKNKNSEELVYVCPLVEENEEGKTVKPYGYDCIDIETMDYETYLKVVKAGKNNVSTLPLKLLKAAWIFYIIFAAITVWVFFHGLILIFDSGKPYLTKIDGLIESMGALFAGLLITLPLLALLTIKYKENKKN